MSEGKVFVRESHQCANERGQTYIECVMSDLSIWHYHQGAETEWSKVKLSDTELTKSFNKFIEKIRGKQTKATAWPV